jgi:hypothetical protein
LGSCAGDIFTRKAVFVSKKMAVQRRVDKKYNNFFFAMKIFGKRPVKREFLPKKGLLCELVQDHLPGLVGIRVGVGFYARRLFTKRAFCPLDGFGEPPRFCVRACAIPF